MLDRSCSTDDKLNFTFKQRRDEEDELSAIRYASLPYPENQLVSLAHSLLKRGFINEADLQSGSPLSAPDSRRSDPWRRVSTSSCHYTWRVQSAACRPVEDNSLTRRRLKQRPRHSALIAHVVPRRTRCPYLQITGSFSSAAHPPRRP